MPKLVCDGKVYYTWIDYCNAQARKRGKRGQREVQAVTKDDLNDIVNRMKELSMDLEKYMRGRPRNKDYDMEGDE